MSRYPQSAAWLARATVIPGQSLTRSKAAAAFYGPEDGPAYASHGDGAYLWDVDGFKYVDMLCALGAISLGYGALSDEYESPVTDVGRVFSLPSTAEVTAAEAILTHVAPWASHVKFTKTGSEATHAARLIARRTTNRRLIARLNDSYHGWHDCWLEDAADTVWMPVNGPEPIGGFKDYAALVIEPPRWTTMGHEWLGGLMRSARDAGALVIFDEMIYGGRWALGGYSEWQKPGANIPDLACYGKALGNGCPIACVVGREAVFINGGLASGTFSGEDASLDMLTAVVNFYKQHPVIETLWKRGRQLQRGLQAVCAPHGNVRVEGQPVHQRIVFTPPKHEWGGADKGFQFAAAMARRGVLWHPACVNISYAHTAEDIETVIEAAEASLQEILT